MPSPSASALALAARYELALAHAPRGGAAGERLGRGAGASVEFQDRRAYAPGDDVRRIDWRAYARTEALFLRLHREEVRPRLEVLLDASRSMAVDPEKAALAVDLAALLAAAARGRGMESALLVLREEAERVALDELLAAGVELDGRAPLSAAARAATLLVRPGTLRVLVSDFLSPHEPAGVVRPLAATAGALALVQVLSRDDAHPPENEALRLVDAETGHALELVLDPRARRRYLTRLRNLSTELERETTRAGGRFAALVADRPLATHARETLVPAGILTPR